MDWAIFFESVQQAYLLTESAVCFTIQVLSMISLLAWDIIWETEGFGSYTFYVENGSWLHGNIFGSGRYKQAGTLDVYCPCKIKDLGHLWLGYIRIMH